MLSRDDPSEEQRKAALDFLYSQEGIRAAPSAELAKFIAKRERELTDRFEKALRDISGSLPAGYWIAVDVDGNYRVCEPD